MGRSRKSLVSLVIFLWSGLHTSQGAEPPTEFQVKAAYLFLFGKYITWPDTADPEFTIGVYGPDPFGSDLEEILAGKRIHDKPVTIKRFQPNAKVEGCQILYIARGVAIDRPLLDDLSKNGILTIGENPKFLEKGGAIKYHLRNSKVQFSINLKVINQLQLKPSSQLLKIAHKVVK